MLSPLIAAVPGARARFLREAQLTSRVRHPHIVDVADMGSDGGNTYLVMEFLHGEDLAQRLERLGPIGAEELADIMLPVCSAVAAAHAAGITHRDLKPQNIFLAAGTRRVLPKVLDFGISKGNDAVTQAGTLTGTGAMIGTPYYLAPEQIMDSKSAGSASDQYALGIILYECLTGKRPYDGDNLFVVFQGIVGGTPKRPREYRPEIPPEMEDVMLRAMKSDPKARFATIEDFGRALLPFASARARMIWDEAFSGGTGERRAAGASVDRRAADADAADARVDADAAGLSNPHGPDPRRVDARAARRAEPVDLAAPRRGHADAAAEDDRACGGCRRIPQPRVADGRDHAGLARIERRRPGPGVDGDVEVASGLHDDRRPGRIDAAPAPARSKKGIIIGALVAVAVVGRRRGVRAARRIQGRGAHAGAGGRARAGRARPAARRAPRRRGARRGARAGRRRPNRPNRRQAKAPPEVKPAAPAAELPEATASAKHDEQERRQEQGQEQAARPCQGGGCQTRGRQAGAAAGVPVID